MATPNFSTLQLSQRGLAVIGAYPTNAVGKHQAQGLALTTTRTGAADASAMGLALA